jgi:hypothetical protein
MPRYVLPFPVVSGKSDAEIKASAERFRSKPSEYRESRQRAGVSMEKVYLQKTPMGNFVVAYVEGSKSYAETLGALMDPSLEINRFFANFVKEVHGVDVSQPPAGPPPETIGEWSDPAVTTRKRGMAFCAPGIPGKEELGKTFSKEAFVTRLAEFTASRRALKENLEVVTLLSTPMGPIISVYLEGDDPFEANRKFAASQSAFDRWFKDECKNVFPPMINFDEPVAGVEEFFDSTALLQKV